MPKKSGNGAATGSTGGRQPTVQDLLNDEADGTLENFTFDPAVCRRAFDHYDKDRSGYLDEKELLKLADKLWDTFFPQGPKLSESNKKDLVSEIVRKTDIDGDSQVTYEEILPWFKTMNEKFWKITHPKTPEQKASEAAAEEAKLAQAKAASDAKAAAESKSANDAKAAEEHKAGERERARERSAPPPSTSEDLKTTSFSPSAIRTNTFSSSPGAYTSLNRSAAIGGAPDLSSDLELLKAKISDLRASVQGFATALDMRLDMCLQSVKMYSTDTGGDGNSGVV